MLSLPYFPFWSNLFLCFFYARACHRHKTAARNQKKQMLSTRCSKRFKAHFFPSRSCPFYYFIRLYNYVGYIQCVLVRFIYTRWHRARESFGPRLSGDARTHQVDSCMQLRFTRPPYYICPSVHSILFAWDASTVEAFGGGDKELSYATAYGWSFNARRVSVAWKNLHLLQAVCPLYSPASR